MQPQPHQHSRGRQQPPQGQNQQGQAPQKPSAGGVTEVRDSLYRHADAPPLANEFEDEFLEPLPLSVLWEESVTPLLKSAFSHGSKFFSAPHKIIMFFYRIFIMRIENSTPNSKHTVKRRRTKKKMIGAQQSR